MSDELFISGKTYISSKQAALTSGYAQDYIGQLARGGLIDSQRVGGLWYVHLSSLTGYKANARDSRPLPPLQVPAHDPESIVSFDGKDYVSANRAAKITSYNQDYIGQLARSGKILSRQIGNRWYVERSALLMHKKEKDGLLAAVQRESVGLAAPQSKIEAYKSTVDRDYMSSGPVLRYFRDQHDLIPTIETAENAPKPVKIRSAPVSVDASYLRAVPMIHTPGILDEDLAEYSSERLDKFKKIGLKSMAALTIVILLSYGLFSIKDASRYASVLRAVPESVLDNNYIGSAATGFNHLGDFIERQVVRELVYRRVENQ